MTKAQYEIKKEKIEEENEEENMKSICSDYYKLIMDTLFQESNYDEQNNVLSCMIPIYTHKNIFVKEYGYISFSHDSWNKYGGMEPILVFLKQLNLYNKFNYVTVSFNIDDVNNYDFHPFDAGVLFYNVDKKPTDKFHYNINENKFLFDHKKYYLLA